MAKIESVRDLPDWFDIEKYKGCESFKAADWYDALFCRSCILSHLPGIDDPELAGSSLHTDIASTRANPVALPDIGVPRSSYIRLPVENLTFRKLLHQCRLERFREPVKRDRWDFCVIALT